jgi:PAS domain S-box-containing protein
MNPGESTSELRPADELELARREIATLRAELAARGNERERRWQQMIDAIDGVVFEYDVDADRFVFVSGRAEALLGYTSEEWCAPGFWSARVHPDDLEGAMAACVQAIHERRDHQLEYRMVGRHGKVAWLRDYCTVIEEGERVRLFGVIVDITASKRVESLMAQASGRLGALVENLPTGVLFGDADGRISFANQAFGKLFGLQDPSSVVGEHAARVMARISTRFVEAERFLSSVGSLTENERSAIGGEFATQLGRAVEVSHAPIHWPRESTGHLWQFTDVTDARRAERILRRVAAGTSRAIGDDFFKALVEHLAGALGVRWAIVDRKSVV